MENNPTPFLDIHTHHPILNQEAGVFAVFNVLNSHIPNSDIHEQSALSAGLHPWWTTTATLTTDLLWLEQQLQLPQCRLLGECGLDRLRGAPLTFQIHAFEQQIMLAQQYQKPMIIHCVRAWHELVQIQKKMRPTVPMIVHGFTGKVSLLQNLLEANFYVSFGAALLQHRPTLRASLENIPLEKLFLETDDSHSSIIDIYTTVATIRQLDMTDLKNIIYHNWQQLHQQTTKK